VASASHSLRSSEPSPNFAFGSFWQGRNFAFGSFWQGRNFAFGSFWRILRANRLALRPLATSLQRFPHVNRLAAMQRQPAYLHHKKK
jgi:hypothetical protein